MWVAILLLLTAAASGASPCPYGNELPGFKLCSRAPWSFTPGDRYVVFDAGMKVGINICYDTNFPEAARAVARAGARLVVCPSNNMMRSATAEEWKHRHNEIRAMRARDAGVWLLSSDVTGHRDGRVSYGPTALIDPDGNVLAHVPLMTPGMLLADVH